MKRDRKENRKLLSETDQGWSLRTALQLDLRWYNHRGESSLVFPKMKY